MFEFLLFIGLTTLPQKGDLLFIKLNCGETCDAIEAVTREQFKLGDEAEFSHIALVDSDSNGLYAIDSWPKLGVRRTALDRYKESIRSKEEAPPQFWLGQIQTKSRHQAERAVDLARTFMGTAYDSEFQLGPKKLYCSELVLFSWKNVFKVDPMYFGKANSKQNIFWHQYYSKLHTHLPEGEPGISPNGIYYYSKIKHLIELPLKLLKMD